MDSDLLLKQALKELMAEDDGVNPNSPIPIDQQLAAKRARYQKMLELQPFKERVQRAAGIIIGEMASTMEPEEYEAFTTELMAAGEALVENPEKQGQELGLTQKSEDLLFAFGEKKLKTENFTDAEAIFTLLTVLDRSWFRHWFFLGVAQQELKEFDEAIKAYAKANEITEEDPLAHLFTAECYAALSDVQNGQLHLDKAKVIMQGMSENIEWQSRVDELESKLK